MSSSSCSYYDDVMPY